MINVHLIASKSNVLENIENLRHIIKFVESKKHNFVHDWVEAAYEERVSKRDNQALPDWSAIYASNLEMIAKSDVVIADTTYNSFGVGYLVANSVQQKKPTLLLRHEKAETDAFATGVVDPWVKRATYTENNVEDILEDFLSENDIATKDMRFNFFIDRKIYNYLRWSSFKSGKTKAEILRELVVREIDQLER